MLRDHSTIRGAMAFLGLICFLSGCGEETEPLPEPEVFTGRIVTKAPAPSEKMPDISPPERVEPEASPPKPETPATLEPAESDGTVPAAVAQVDEPEVKGTEGFAYDPKGRPDPFAPWFKEGPSASAAGAREPRPRLTPLEKLDWDQLTLVGIIRSASGNTAIIEETSGKGYVVEKGAYIGRNRGKVTEIRRDRVIIEEVLEHGANESSLSERELVLQKPAGED